jgi:hypothetical protein
MRAIAHGVVGTCAGLLGLALIGRQLASSGAFVDPSRAWYLPLFLSFIGLGAAFVKAVAGALSTYGQERRRFRFETQSDRPSPTPSFRKGGSQPRLSPLMPRSPHASERSSAASMKGFLKASVRSLASFSLAAARILLSSRLALAALGILAPFAFVRTGVRPYFVHIMRGPRTSLKTSRPVWTN